MRFLLLCVTLPVAACGGRNGDSSSSWCRENGTHDFCADFDGPDAFAGWDRMWRSRDGEEVIAAEVIASERSPPSALRASSTVTTHTVLWKYVDHPATTKVSVELDLFVASLDHGTVVSLSGAGAPGVATVGASIAIDGDNASLDVYRGPTVPLARDTARAVD